MTSSAALLNAIQSADPTAAVAALEADPAASEARDETSGVSLLMTALYHRQPEIAEAIAGHRPTLDVFEATSLGRADAVEACLARADTDLQARSPDGFTALHFAAYFGHHDVVALLLARGAQPNVAADNPMKVLPLHSAAAAPSLESVKLLLDAGAHVDAVQEGGFTALQAAAHGGQVDMVRCLLEYGADSDRRNDAGKSARDLAAERGHADVVALFA